MSIVSHSVVPAADFPVARRKNRPARRPLANVVPSPGPMLGKPHAKGYRAKIGGKRFWFGRDTGQAKELLGIIAAEWKAIERASANGPAGGASPAWTEDALERIEKTKAGQQAATRDATGGQAPPASIPKSVPAPHPVPVAAAPLVHLIPGVGTTMLLSAAIDGYIDRRREDMQAGQIQASRLSLIRYSLARLRWAIADQPLALIGPDEVRGLVQFFLRRPVSPSRGTALGPQTVIETLYFARKFFEHLLEQNLWSTVKPLDRLFDYRRDKLFTDAEREALSDVKVFTLAELRTIWHAAGEGSRSQLYIALALNAGFTQTEIATLRHAHLHLEGDKPYLQRFRHKTGVRCKWRLWPETVSLLRLHMTDPTMNDLALLGLSGRPLVRISESGRADDIRHDWHKVRRRIETLLKKKEKYFEQWMASFNALRDEAPAVAERLLEDLQRPIDPTMTVAPVQPTTCLVPVRPLGFKFLRKTASNLIRRIEDKDTAEVFLAHVDPTVGRKYHNPDFKRLSRGLRKLRARIWTAHQPAATASPTQQNVEPNQNNPSPLGEVR